MHLCETRLVRGQVRFNATFSRQPPSCWRVLALAVMFCSQVEVDAVLSVLCALVIVDTKERAILLADRILAHIKSLFQLLYRLVC